LAHLARARRLVPTVPGLIGLSGGIGGLPLAGGTGGRMERFGMTRSRQSERNLNACRWDKHFSYCIQGRIAFCGCILLHKFGKVRGVKRF
jgi:hypothetical protein